MIFFSDLANSYIDIYLCKIPCSILNVDPIKGGRKHKILIFYAHKTKKPHFVK